MTAFGVISDAILIAFYPQFFQLRYNIESPIHAGNYIAAISIAVMCALPVWAKVATIIETMPMLLFTQLTAGVLGIASAFAPSLLSFWIISLLMYMTKASYLLMFPYLMRLEKQEYHAHLVGLLSFIVHITAIFAATIGGFSLQRFGPQFCVILMAIGDFIQMAICFYLIKANKIAQTIHASTEHDSNEPTNKEIHNKDQKIIASNTSQLPSKKRPRSLWISLLKLSLVMLTFDFSAYLIRPFFSTYWEETTGILNRGLTGAIFAIPALAALVGVFVNRLASQGKLPALDNTLLNIALGAVGLGLQSLPSIEAIIFGRFLFGWGMFQMIVKLEVKLFKISSPEYYARDFSVANFFQNLGVLLSSFSAGYIVNFIGIQQTFVIAALGFLLTAIIDRIFFSTVQAQEKGDSTNAV
ncbi:MFS transporter [Marinomonas sp.]|uniref:MFS transporter n=1 Tax=Marinomonas sp. TaxID=1904862 RepID=UPI003BACF8ED